MPQIIGRELIKPGIGVPAPGKAVFTMRCDADCSHTWDYEINNADKMEIFVNDLMEREMLPSDCICPHCNICQ